MSGRKPIILLVGDIVDDSDVSFERPIFDEDNPSRGEVANLVTWINDAGYDVEVFEDVREFLEFELMRDNVLVFPLWRGGPSRNRTAIVPAHCEARDIPFVGGDVYVQSVCQDKSLSKLLANAAGMKIPNEMVLRSEADADLFSPSSRLRSPFVVKPLYSACSIGIHDSSLCWSDEYTSPQ